MLQYVGQYSLTQFQAMTKLFPLLNFIPLFSFVLNVLDLNL